MKFSAVRWAARFAAPLAVLLSALPTARVAATTAYVSDELVLGVYSEQNNQGQRLSTLHSGASVETLQVNGEFTEVRLNDGTTGWVKSAYLTTREPATARLKQLEDELDRSRATTPALAEAAARNEVRQLQRALTDKQAELDAARQRLAAPPTYTDVATYAGGASVQLHPGVQLHPWIVVLALLAALACGFGLGYIHLARRVRRKFGGIKVY